MFILNSDVIYHLIHLRRTIRLQNSCIRYRAITITLVITTFLFLFMTTHQQLLLLPFFLNTTSEFVLYTLDSMLYTYHILSFLLYIITFDEFKEEFLRIFKYNINYNQRIAPLIILRNTN